MRIALCSSFVPFIDGGYRNIVNWLEHYLKERGHQVEVVYIPEVDAFDSLFREMMAYRWIDLNSADRIICFRPQSHLIPHKNKILWFIHHIRIFYDLWDTPYRDFPEDGKSLGLRNALRDLDTKALHEAEKIFTNSKVVSNRLKTFNNCESEVLYPPVFKPERFFANDFNDEIVCICRLEHHKRQHLLIEALEFTKTPVRLRLCGTSSGESYPLTLLSLAKDLGVEDRVIIENRWITEEEKILLLSDCLAAAYLPFDEDSYGYPTLEAAHASKCIVTTKDSGGVMEFVQDKRNGFVCDPSPNSIAASLDILYLQKNVARELGINAHSRVFELNISWDYVLDKLLA